MKTFLISSVLSYFLLTSCGVNETKAEIIQPNIIWLMAEDISNDLECYGMKAVKTPNLNKMATEGIKFENCFVTNPICSPSRSSMMVGTHQLKINAQHHRSNRDVPLQEGVYPFTYWLKKAGYTTILGHHGVMAKGRKIDVNFKYENLGEWDGKTKFGIFDKYDSFEKEDQPFFAQIQLKATHRGGWWDEVRAKSAHPVNPDEVELPEFMADDPMIRLDWAKYLDQMEFIDNEVGMIFKELEEKEMIDNTVVIFIGDNGRCNIRGKGYLHDPGLRIPLIVYYPSKYKGGQVREDVVSSTDITASILEIAKAEMPDYLTGKPIFAQPSGREFVYGARDLWDEIMEKSRAVTSGKWKYIRNDKPEISLDAHQAYLEFYRPAVHVMRTLNEEGKLNDAQKFFFEPTKPKEELYDLENDPQELVNLAHKEKYQEVLHKLRTQTQDFDEKMKSEAGTLDIKPVPGQSLVKWFVENFPEAHKKMQSGIEVGYKIYSKKYKKHLAKKKK